MPCRPHCGLISFACGHLWHSCCTLCLQPVSSAIEFHLCLMSFSSAGTGLMHPQPDFQDADMGMGPMDQDGGMYDAGQHDAAGLPDMAWDGNLSLDNNPASNFGSQPGSSNPGSRRGSFGVGSRGQGPPETARSVPMFERQAPAGLDVVRLCMPAGYVVGCV